MYVVKQGFLFSEYMEPPPKYDDIVKLSSTVPGVHRVAAGPVQLL